MSNKHTPHPIKKVLIANRAEIALRIQYTCRALGIKTVAIYTKDDAQKKYVHYADEAYELSAQGYAAHLAQDEIIDIALKAGADAIHPGYGFLSENAQFARKVTNTGMMWIGPTHEHIALMGNKIKARMIMEAAGIPVVPGGFIATQSTNSKTEAHNRAQKIGFPVIIKDPQSGGGKAMRMVSHLEHFDSAWESTCAEAHRLTGSSELLIEKYIQHGRHIEIQVAGDGNNAIHFYERECSIQRRHQKMVEETPCSFISSKTLKKMYTAAIQAVCAVQYKNIGTVEFIVTPDENFYFLEMNTRLQVEHSVTELTTGIDLVDLQFHIAQTNELPLKQKDIHRNGHALECRIYAEDPQKNFTPSNGTITHLQLPNGPFIRHDHDLEDGHEITPFFDPMISKITTFSPTRNQAIAHMQEALRQYIICGVETNIEFLIHLITSPDFKQGLFHTQYLDEFKIQEILTQSQGTTKQITANEIKIIVATIMHLLKENGLIADQKIKKTTTATTYNAWKDQVWK